MSGSKLELNEEQQVALDQVGFTKNLFFFLKSVLHDKMCQLILFSMNSVFLRDFLISLGMR
jgi:hypothetical protein